ncbi:hypothetical protein TVAG_268400 [Trichomonas vaginalis G3]|uniref:Uncharacterized protein n=1 Tax=Trichomonas vaginalis (strain ATCC PRA-98 / G3) TaxID=412133 RepID=A2DLI9_TRIV3|nr:hypothetical protein TVAGG3_0013240 [Trichomonas vaginalis G3]EAY18807.1 hypothetical protein TVAG_268400 [Trichomonas vaginalis G3]KAI5539254.1 hypothetical protein TVAGG3_0013240 [Trichomonas vaginalis G3]|eukprot:XP_001579793.1 hypothetical protein [Trichomonas vaginalis G3]
MNFVKNLIRKYFGRLHYSTGLVYNDTLARKTRIWQRFWRSLFKSRELYVDVEKRMQELVDICTKEGITNFRNDLFAPNDAIKQARKLSFFLEGPDCYFRSDSVKDPTCWGRMFINLFPFQLTIIYDVSEKSVIIDDEIVCEFVNQNKQSDILLSRKFRQMLRCLRDERVNYKFSEIVPIKTACGKKERLVDFQSGILRIKQKCNDPFSHGFKVRLELDDGKYIDDDGTEVTGIKYTAKEADLGITSDFSQTPELLQLFNSNKEIIDAKWPEIQQRLTWMHDDLMEFRQEQLEVLSNVFYMMVYNNDKIPRAEMESFLTKYEQNPTVQNIPELERLNLDGLYDRLKFYDVHPAFAFWYNFFDDIAVRNSVIKKISTNADLFDMSAGTALAYHPMPVEKLKEILESRWLRTKKGGGLFNDKVMNLFEEKLNAACNNAPVPETEIKVSSMSENLMTDPLMIGTPLVTENTTYLATAAMTAFTGS